MSHFNTLVEPLNSGITKFGHEKLETSLYRVVQTVFLYLEPFRRES